MRAAARFFRQPERSEDLNVRALSGDVEREFLVDIIARRASQRVKSRRDVCAFADLTKRRDLELRFAELDVQGQAVKLGFWQWENGIIPLYNYVCWFLISVFLLVLLRKFPFPRANHFAVHLFIIQLLFFWILRTFWAIDQSPGFFYC